MRNGLLGGLLLLLTAGSAHAQPWPAPGWGYPGYPPMGYGPAYPPYTAPVPGYPLQLVQVLHRRTADRWMERSEWVTDDLERMFWSKLRAMRMSTLSKTRDILSQA